MRNKTAPGYFQRRRFLRLNCDGLSKTCGYLKIIEASHAIGRRNVLTNARAAGLRLM